MWLFWFDLCHFLRLPNKPFFEKNIITTKPKIDLVTKEKNEMKLSFRDKFWAS